MCGRRIVIGVSGGIAAYKACEVVSRLKSRGADVWVVMTRNATQFVAPATYRALTGRPVALEMFSDNIEWEMQHLSLAEFAEVILIAPATANVIGKIASGIADDLLTTAVLAADCPVLIAPAMNFRMWANPAVQDNIATAKRRGIEIIEPEEGRLAEGTYGKGRLAKVAVLIEALEKALACGTSVAETGSARGPLAGKRIVVTAGPTREPLDPVRYISNRSSGKQGYALAEEARDRGACVTLVTGPTALPKPEGVQIVEVVTAAEMAAAVRERLGEMDVFIAAAAVADYTPATVAPEKIKKTRETLTLELARTEDVLSTVGREAEGCVKVGFAAETGNLREGALAKLRSKNLDLVVANDVSHTDIGFDVDENQVTIFRADGSLREVHKAAKRAIAAAVLDEVQAVLAGR